MKKGSTWFLRGVIVLMGLLGIAIGIFALPSVVRGVPAEFPVINKALLYLFIGGLYFSAIPFFIALHQALKLLTRIDKNETFGESSVRALKIIKYCGIAVSVGFATGIPILFQIAEIDDAPGLGLIALAFACAPLVIATFAAVLQMLLKNAIDIKSENDLTV